MDDTLFNISVELGWNKFRVYIWPKYNKSKTNHGLTNFRTLVIGWLVHTEHSVFIEVMILLWFLLEASHFIDCGIE